MRIPGLAFRQCRNAAVTISGIGLVQKIGKEQFDTSAVMVREGASVRHMWEAVLVT